MTAIAYLALIVWSAVLSAIDIRSRRLPDLLTLPGAATIVAVAASTGCGTVALAGAVLLAVPYLLVHLAHPTSCGAGDVKLALGTGAAAACGGGHCWVVAAFGAPLLTAAAGLGALIAARPVIGTEATVPADARAAPGRALRWRRRGRTGGLHSAREPAITVPHGPAMCLATVAALWATR